VPLDEAAQPFTDHRVVVHDQYSRG